MVTIVQNTFAFYIEKVASSTICVFCIDNFKNGLSELEKGFLFGSLSSINQDEKRVRFSFF
jgi:hypothetical protein